MTSAVCDVFNSEFLLRFFSDIVQNNHEKSESSSLTGNCLLIGFKQNYQIMYEMLSHC
jgi:hypothetical protein